MQTNKAPLPLLTLAALEEEARTLQTEAASGTLRARGKFKGSLGVLESPPTCAEAREIVRLAREAAEKVDQEIVSNARQEAQRTTEQARRAIESEKQAAIAELRKETADLAVKAAGALIEANLDDERNRKLVEDLIAGIPSDS